MVVVMVVVVVVAVVVVVVVVAPHVHPTFAPSNDTAMADHETKTIRHIF